MTDFIVTPSSLRGQTSIPASKSQTLRAILFGMLGTGQSIVRNYLPSPDTQAMIHACTCLGATIETSSNTIQINGTSGQIHPINDLIDAGNSGIVLRFIAAIAALSSHPVTLTGDHSIRTNRPVHALLTGLKQLGASAKSIENVGYAPITIKGPLKGGSATVSGEDSQPVSALIIASAFASKPVNLQVLNPGEKPWINLTLSWLDRLHIPYENREFQHYQLLGNCQYNGFRYDVPGDLSSIAFPIIAALITQSEICIHNVDLSDAQGDKKLIFILQEMGAQIIIDATNKSLLIKKSSRLRGRIIDINDCIDSIAALSVIACFAEGETQLINGAVARQKECDRIHCLAKELNKMGADITELEDGLLIKQSSLQGAIVDSHQDHRMAMALTIAGLAAQGTTKVRNTECIKKTYPNFLNEFVALGALIK